MATPPPSPSLTLSASDLEQLFPYHFHVDDHGDLSHLSPALRALPATVRRFEDFTVAPCPAKAGGEQSPRALPLREAPARYTLRPKGSERTVHGVFVKRAGGWFFLGCPLLNGADFFTPPGAGDENLSSPFAAGLYPTQSGDRSVQEGALVSIVSHEFRTPLTAIDGTIFLLRKILRSPGAVAEAHAASVNRWLDLLSSATGTLKGLVDQVLTYSRLERADDNIQIHPEDPARLTSEVIGVLNAALPAPRIDFSNELPAGYTASFDALAVRPAIENLISNALKYSPADTMVTVRLSLHEAGWRIAVADKGRGIPVEDQKRLFSPFFRARNVGAVPGSGLGLAIVLKAAKSHGAALTFTSSENAGSRFELSFPAAPALICRAGSLNPFV